MEMGNRYMVGGMSNLICSIFSKHGTITTYRLVAAIRSEQRLGAPAHFT